MKSYNTLYFLLVVLLIMGAFASMAQNSYGFTIIGSVAIAFGLIFLYQAIVIASKKMSRKIIPVIEMLSLSVMSFIFALRIFHVYFPHVELIFGTAGLALSVIYLTAMVKRFREFRNSGFYPALLTAFYYSAIIIFILAMMFAPYIPWLSRAAGLISFILMILFAIGGAFTFNFSKDGEERSVYTFINHFRDRSVLLFSLFFLISVYVGLNSVGVLPGLYSDEYPQAYFELIRKAETGGESPVNGKYEHEEFRERYNEFLSRNSNTDRK